MLLAGALQRSVAAGALQSQQTAQQTETEGVRDG